MKKILISITIFLFITSCGIYRPTDARKVPVNANERVKKNMEEGRGFRISGLGKKEVVILCFLLQILYGEHQWIN